MSRALLGVTFLTTGVLHFLRPRMYEAIMPRYLPAHRELVYASGVAEIAGGAGVLHARTRKGAGWWLIATLVGDLPGQRRDGRQRRPLQAVPEAAAVGAAAAAGRTDRVGVADRGALTAAVAVARAHGLTVTDPVILRDQLNVLVHLRPAPVVARVAGTIARVRPGLAWQRREVAIAGHLASRARRWWRRATSCRRARTSTTGT